MSNAQADPVSSGQPPVPDSVRVQILATEHWSLLATRSLLWNETFSRVGMFITSLSTASVALALVAQVAAFKDEFSIFALLVLPVVLFLGIGTLLRLNNSRDEDVWQVIGMNRLRRAYLDIDPDLEKYFITSPFDDMPGVMLTYNPTYPSLLTRILGSTPVLVGVINASLAGVIVALLVEFFVADPLVYVPLGVVVGMIAAALMVGVLPTREITRLERQHAPRFPRSAPDTQ